MNIKRILLTDNKEQALRIKQLLVEHNIPYAYVGLLIAYALWFNLLPQYPTPSIFIIPIMANIVFYGLIRSNLNLHFKEPSLIVPQVVYGIGAYMFVIYFANEVRGAFLMMTLGAPITVVLRLRPKELYWISLLPLLLLGGIIAIQHTQGTRNDLAVDMLQWFALVGGITWLSYDGIYLAKKRQEKIQNTNKLTLAVTENILLINNLIQQKQIAEAANLANLEKTRILASANHDLRQPLHALSLFVAQLQGCTSAQQRINLTKKIESAVASINDLFEDLLDISKLDEDIIVSNISSVSLQPLFNRLDNTFAELANKKGLSIRFVKTRLCIKSEFILLERILLNLITNALRYTEKGTILVGCRLSGNDVHIQVWDTGQGIANDQQRHIFKEFFRIKQNNVDENSGLGLGLAIVERLCTLLDHEILLRSKLNKGSCFTIIAPLAAATSPPASVSQNCIHLCYENKWILIIDDDLMVRDAMHGLLSEWQCQVLVAGSADEAMQLLIAQQSKPDLIISDYTLQNNMNGICAITQIRTYFNFNIPAFLISGNTDPDKLREIQTQGFTMLHKPLKPMALRALLGKFLQTA